MRSTFRRRLIFEAYVIEHATTRVTAEADGSETREAAAEVKMLADAGVKAFAVLNFTYTSANEVVDIDFVRVHVTCRIHTSRVRNLVRCPKQNRALAGAV